MSAKAGTRKSAGRGAQKSAQPRKQGGKGKPFEPGNPWRIKPGQVLNPGGRPKLLSESYKQFMEHADEQGVTNAAKIAYAVGAKAVDGDIPAAREMRQTTEGDRLTFDVTRLTDEQLDRLADGEDIRAVLANPGVGRAGAPAPEEPGDADDAPGH